MLVKKVRVGRGRRRGGGGFEGRGETLLNDMLSHTVLLTESIGLHFNMAGTLLRNLKTPGLTWLWN